VGKYREGFDCREEKRQVECLDQPKADLKMTPEEREKYAPWVLEMLAARLRREGIRLV